MQTNDYMDWEAKLQNSSIIVCTSRVNGNHLNIKHFIELPNTHKQVRKWNKFP